MNTKQKVALWTGIIIVVIMGLFPPWLHTRIIDVIGALEVRTYYYDYPFILNAPQGNMLGKTHLDFKRLIIQWIIIAIIVGGFMKTFSKHRSPTNVKKGDQP